MGDSMKMSSQEKKILIGVIVGFVVILAIIFCVKMGNSSGIDAISIVKEDKYNYCTHTTEEALEFYYGGDLEWSDNGEDKVTVEANDDGVEYLWVINYEQINDNRISYSFDELYIDGNLQDYDSTQYELNAIFSN